MKTQSNSLLRKIITIVFLPIIVIVWMTGWTLMQIGSAWRHQKIKQDAPHASSEFESQDESEIRKVDEDDRIVDQPLVA